MNLHSLILLVSTNPLLIEMMSRIGRNLDCIFEYCDKLHSNKDQLSNYSCIILENSTQCVKGLKTPIVIIDSINQFSPQDKEKLIKQGIFDVTTTKELEVSISVLKAINYSNTINKFISNIGEMEIRLSENTLKLDKLKNTDQLTGLPNSDHIRKIINGLVKQQKPINLILFKLNGLQELNAHLGVETGDNILKQIIHKIQNNLTCYDVHIGRYLSNVFCIIFEDYTIKEDVKNSLLESLIFPFGYSNFIHHQTICAGLYSTNQVDDWKDVFRRAEIALNISKKGGKNSIVEFTESMIEKQNRKKGIERSLRESLQKDGFDIHYQPIYNKKSAIVGFEALMRWNSPEFGFVSPGEFIPIAEETGLIIEMGKWIIKTATKQMQQWHSTMPKRKKKPFVAVNISPMQFVDSMGLINSIIEALRSSQLSAEYLKLEITESLLMETGGEKSIHVLKQLKNIGCQIAIDDFGTGYSSLAYLSRFPIDTLKIDKSFITLLEESDIDRSIVKSIVNLAKTLHLEIVAEGVENELQFNLLKKLECELYQGFLLSKPLNKKLAQELISNI